MALVERSSLEIDTSEGAEVKTEVGFTFRDVTIRSGDVTLEARLYVPTDRARPLPAAVVNHGSAPTSFGEMSFFVATSLEVGVAALAYSKRGCGGSTGEYLPVTVEASEEILGQLAGDAAAALRWLKNQPEVDAGRAGFIGGSQAGWVSPLAATREHAAFIVSVAGASVSVGEEEYHGMLVGDGHEAMRQVPTPVADRMLLDYSGPRGYDPRATLANLEVDSLWIFGTGDQVIPVRASIEELERLRAAGNRHHLIYVVEGADHNMVIAQTGRPFGLASRLEAWLSEIGVLRADEGPASE